MLVSFVFMWSLVAVCAIALARLPPERREGLFARTWESARFMLIRMPIALLGAGFAATLLPADVVGAWLGGASGLSGIFIASAVGAITPGGPLVSFPLALALAKTGVGVPQLIAFLTAWNVIPISMLIGWEIPIVGARFSIARYIASLPLSVVAGVAAAAIMEFWPVEYQFSM